MPDPSLTDREARLRALIAQWRDAADLPTSEYPNAELVRAGKTYAFLACADDLEALLTPRAGDSDESQELRELAESFHREGELHKARLLDRAADVLAAPRAGEAPQESQP